MSWESRQGGGMKALGEATSRAARHRRFHWCRRPNGFSDMPIWRVVAGNLGLPLYQVLAFANRLEELGNAAANFGETRGAVARFSAEEFATALGMTADDALRIFTELERPEIGWVAYSHIADFYDRNPDREDEGAAERKRRQRLRDTIRRQLASLARKGSIGERERIGMEELLGGSEGELRHLQIRLARVELEADANVTGVTRDMSRGVTRDIETPYFSMPENEQHVTRDGRMSQRDIVTVTPEQSRDIKEGAVLAPLGANLTPLDPVVFAEPARALQWLKGDGGAIVAHRLGGLRHKADDQVLRWGTTLCNDMVALARIVHATLATEARGEAFRRLIETQVARHAAELIKGPQLPLMPPRPGQRQEG